MVMVMLTENQPRHVQRSLTCRAELDTGRDEVQHRRRPKAMSSSEFGAEGPHEQ
jgi:hypothetical protein